MSPDWTDDDLLIELGAAFAETADTPEHIARAGRDLYGWRTVDAELSELLHDSATAIDPVLVRDAGPATRRSLTFRSSRLTIEVDLEREPDAIRGQVVPNGTDAVAPDAIVVEVVGETATTAPVDAVGYFAFDPFPLLRGRLRLRCGDVVTPWID
jgi:hypothetical protein